MALTKIRISIIRCGLKEILVSFVKDPLIQITDNTALKMF